MRVNPSSSSSFPIHRWLCSLAAGQPIRAGRQGGRSNLCDAKNLDRLLATFLRAGVSGVGVFSGVARCAGSPTTRWIGGPESALAGRGRALRPLAPRLGRARWVPARSQAFAIASRPLARRADQANFQRDGQPRTTFGVYESRSPERRGMCNDSLSRPPEVTDSTGG